MERFIYQLMLPGDVRQNAASINAWPLNVEKVSDIDAASRQRAIDSLRRRLPEECFTIHGDKLTFKGDLGKCAQDYGEQLIDIAINVRAHGFAATRRDFTQVVTELYGIRDMFFIGNKANLMSIVSLLCLLDDHKYGRTAFTIGSVTLIED